MLFSGLRFVAIGALLMLPGVLGAGALKGWTRNLQKFPSSQFAASFMGLQLLLPLSQNFGHFLTGQALCSDIAEEGGAQGWAWKVLEIHGPPTWLHTGVL